MDRRLRDSFYCGLWIVKKGTKKERTIDLTEITLMDGTRFVSAIGKDDFARLQTIRQGNKNGKAVTTKRINPFPKLITCHSCGANMYACYRNVRISGGQVEKRLGYECQGKPDGKACTQPRVKVEVVFERMAQELAKRSHNLNQLRYRRYLVALHAFTKKKKAEQKTERHRLASALKKAEAEKQKLISQRASMISQDLYDTHSKAQFEKQIEELTETIADLKYRRSIA